LAETEPWLEILIGCLVAAAGLGLWLRERSRRRAAQACCRVLEAEVAERALAEERYRLLFLRAHVRLSRP
jgi:uncharacterized membrane protein YccC